jgi:PAS domain S-box-containing protein
MRDGNRPPSKADRPDRQRPRRDDRFRIAVESSPAAIVLVDREGKIDYANVKTRELFGYERRELEGRSIEILVPDRYRDGHPAHRERFLADPVARPMGAGRDLFGRRQDGSEFPIEIGLNPIETEDGTFVLVSIVDISERKRAEDRLRRTAEDLARSNSDLEQFAYAASHDLQEPLRMITSYLQLLERRYMGADENARMCVGHAVQGAQHMGLLIDGLLAYSRAGTSGMKLTRFPAGRAVERAVLNLQAAIEASRATLSTSELPEIEADLVLLAEVFQNLIANAIKFCSGPAPRIEISCESSDEDWLFRVRDNGIGIDTAYAERIFGVFQRLHPRDRYPGSGIGLSISRKIVERHGGSIRLGSSGADGSEFVFTLPKRQAAEE